MSTDNVKTKDMPKKAEEFELTASIVGGDGFDPLRPLVVRPTEGANDGKQRTGKDGKAS